MVNINFNSIKLHLKFQFFYILANGKNQPGCGLDLMGICAHSRAWQYYRESIKHDRFYAFQCESFENLVSGKCSVINLYPVRMGGEPGNNM